MASLSLCKMVTIEHVYVAGGALQEGVVHVLLQPISADESPVRMELPMATLLCNVHYLKGVFCVVCWLFKSKPFS
jgi:hypothetical protein